MNKLKKFFIKKRNALRYAITGRRELPENPPPYPSLRWGLRVSELNTWEWYHRDGKETNNAT